MQRVAAIKLSFRPLGLRHCPIGLWQFSYRKIVVPNRSIPHPQCKNVLITAALPYVNNTPHLGNIIGGVLSADAYARYCRMRGYNVMFVSGTDEYGTTTLVKALEEQTTPQEICDKYHALHRSIYEWFQIQFDYFGRTSDPIHSDLSLEIFAKIHDNHFIGRKHSHHFYCPNCALTLADRYVKGSCSHCRAPNAKGDQCDACSTVFKDPIQELLEPRCAVCAATPVTKNSQHLYLKLASLSGRLEKWLLGQDGMRLWSNNARAVTKAWLAHKLEDRCITRDLAWGVPVPAKYFSEGVKKVLYVWFEAPIGYISMTAGAVGRGWQKWWTPEPDTEVQLVQFMGKDNIVFHSTMAPATLMATGEPFIRPTRLAVTEYLMYEGGKFSKSNNMGVFGNDCQQTGIDSDVWRYYLLSSRPQAYDSEFTWSGLATRNNKDLLNSLGNMVNRVLKYLASKHSARVPTIHLPLYTALENQLVEDLVASIKEYCEQMERVELKSAAGTLLQVSHRLNRYIQESCFWDKQHVNSGRTSLILGLVVRILHFYAILLRPFIPKTSAKILSMIGGEGESMIGFPLGKEPWDVFRQALTSESAIETDNQVWCQKSVQTPSILFHEISQERVDQLSSRYGSSR